MLNLRKENQTNVIVSKTQTNEIKTNINIDCEMCSKYSKNNNKNENSTQKSKQNMK